MKIYWKKLLLAIIISAFSSIIYAWLFFHDGLESGKTNIELLWVYTGLVFLGLFFVETLILYIFVCALTITETEQVTLPNGEINIIEHKGFWYNTKKFFKLYYFLQLAGYAFFGILFLTILLIFYLNNFFSLYISISLGLIVALCVILPFYLLFSSLNKRKKAIEKELDEEFGT